MEKLYKVDKIVGKGFGWIALKNIKVGTMICKEKPQFFPEKIPMELDPPSIHFSNLMNTFFAMSNENQKEFLELSNAYSDPNSLNDEAKKLYFGWKTDTENQNQFDSKLLLKIICICQTNQFGDGFGEICIKISRINHSCCSNSDYFTNDDGEMEIRATSKILEGQEITINYAGTNDMRKLKERRHGFQIYGFVCFCDLCQNEEINNDNETYDKFQNLKKEAEEIFSNFMSLAKQDSHLEQYDKLVKAIACQKEMYNLAKKKKAPKLFILRHIIEKAFMQGVTGYEFASLDFSCFQKNYDKMEYFKSECEKLSMVGYQIAKMCYGREGKMAKEWKERNQDFENWCKTFLKSQRK